ncbi:F0F1 ATP synthase subunit delta [Marinobacter nanhaiticus D15-8W]|uniref:ATP synthase subunit delta n=1 Tax=Marinobacter nanhaiticus D15-8W TaxID=626887 RepID=N6WUV9_9GAMM|nr:F0F1 ATP synthase subunit delta [Marinobacter nanhaiticus]ENO15346.1 F0F1 ATP synthase subunit delta [Marinobacter nanhaiticus D15-8W]BES73808.1 F0F1 ATP synthase subunit delta [Marinobacter nanhaiticus D15-8W]
MAELTTLARPYAKAAFQTARDQDKLVEWADSLSFAAQAASDSDMRTVLGSPNLTEARKAEFLIDLFDGSVSEQFRNFVSILSEGKRLALLPEINDLYNAYRADIERVVDVEVTAPFELTEEQQQTLSQALSKKLDRKVSLATKVDPALIGGVVIRAGDMVIDASVRGKIAKLVDALGS